MQNLMQQMEFIIEIDKLKDIERRNLILQGKRFENTAEHSWSLGIMAMLLCEHANEPVDQVNVMKMVLVHDIVEIDAGDTYCYDTKGYEDKADREKQAADRLFGMLNDAQQREFRALWDEFEDRATADAKFANAIDRILPLMQNWQANGVPWKKRNIRVDQVRERMAPVRDGSVEIWELSEHIIQQAHEKGYLQDA